MQINRWSFLLPLSVAISLAAFYKAASFGSTVIAQEIEIAQSQLPGEGVTLRPAYGTLEELFQTEVINIGLEQLGYRVIPGSEVEYDIIHTAIAKGYLDYTASHWNLLHNGYYEQNGGGETMQRVGTLIEDAQQGYLIDKATAEQYNITNLEQLKDPKLARLFDTDGDGKANLTGCNPGWGCATVIEHHFNAYELRDTIEHDQGNYFALMNQTISRYEQNQPIFYYTWTPLWISQELTPDEDVTWLEVPYTDLPRDRAEKVNTTVNGKNLGFAVNQIGVLANSQFLAENPAAKRFLELAQIPIADISAQNRLMHNGENTPAEIREHAEQWIQSNRQEFEGWLEQAKAAQ